MCAETLQVELDFRRGDFRLRLDEAFALRGITGIWGPSGSGKSTLLRSISGLERADGRIVWGDEVWLDSSAGRDVAAHRRPVAHMFQDARLFAHLSVEGNLRFAERRADRRSEAPEISFADAVEALDLDRLLPRSTLDLSGGEQQRVALARTLLTRPRLLLLDEPLAALDSGRRFEILRYIEALHSRFGLPMLYVTHAIDEVALLADEVLVLDDGRRLARGPVQETLDRQQALPLGDRDSSLSIVESKVLGHDADLHLVWLDVDGQRISVPESEPMVAGEPVRLLIAARDVSLATVEPTSLSIRNVLRGRIAALEEDPESAFAEATIELGSATLRARITRASLYDLELAEGREVFALLKTVSVDRTLSRA